MAKIKETDDLDDLNFDDLGDFDDFGGFNDFEPTTAKRSVFSRLAGGFKDGVKASFTDPKNHRTVIKEALPKGYSRIYDSTEFTVESVNDLLSTARKGYGDNEDQMKKALREILPSLGGFTDQNKVGKNLKAWSEDIRQPHVYEDVDPEQAFMTTEIGDVFGNTNSSAVGNRSTPEDRARAQGKVSETAQRKLMEHASRTSQILSDRVGMQTSHDTLRHLSGMHSQLQRLTAYQDQVTNAYQRKSLEIKYRHYFVSRKSLDVLMQGLELNQAAYDKIITNTSLPEAVKIQNSEHAMMIMREKFLGDITSPAQAKFGTIGRRVVQKAKGNIQEFFRSLGANLAGFTDSISAMLGEDSGIDIAELGGDVAGSWAGGYGMKRLAGKASRFLGRNKKLARMGAAGAGFLDNAGRVFQSALKNDTGIGWFEMLKNTGFLDEFAYRRNETIRKDATSMLDDQAMWDQKSRKALTEVIPGLLERTNFSVASILAHLTGKPAPVMERYNYSSGLFESDTAVRKRIHSDLLGERANNDTAQAIRNFVAEFETKRKLSPEAKEALMRLSLDESLNGGQMNMEAYMRGDKQFSKDEKIQKEIHAAFMENFYADRIDGVDDGDGSFIGDMNRTFRRSSSSHARLKLMNSLQGISNNMGIYDQSAVLKHMGAAGANTMLDMGIVYQDGNELKLNREKLDGTIIAQAMKMDPGYLASTLFDHLEDENTLGTSGSSNVRKMIHDLDRRFKDEVSAHDINYLRFCFDTLKQQLFAGANAELLGSTDLDTSDKRQILELAVAKLIGFTKTPQYNAMTDQGQEYFKFRIDIMKKATTVAKFYAPLKDFFTKPLEVEKDLWGKSKDAALQNLADAGLDPEIVDKLKQTIRNVKDYSGKTVDMKIAELTGTKTYGEAAAVLNRMSNNGLSWLTKAMRDPNSPPPEEDNVASLFKQTKDATEYLAKHSAFGRIVYKGFLQVESAVNNDYQNIVENQGKISQLDKLAGNANGEDFFYTSEFGFKKMNPLGASGFGVRQAGSMGYNSGSILNEDTKLESLTKNKDDKIVKSAVDRLVRVGDRIAEELKTYVENGGKLRPTRENFMGPMGDFNNPDFVGPMPVDIEIHHAGGIAGRGRKWGGGGMFSSAQRYHTGGVVKGQLQVNLDGGQSGLFRAVLPNGQTITVMDHRLRKKGSKATPSDIEAATTRVRNRIMKDRRYKQYFTPSTATNPNATGLKPGEVPAVLQEGEEVLTANDPRHRNNVGKDNLGGFTSSSDEYLQGILENTSIANELLIEIASKEFMGGTDPKKLGFFGKMKQRIGKGYSSSKDRAKRGADYIRNSVSNIFSSGMTKWHSAKNSVKDFFKGNGVGQMYGTAKEWVKDRAMQARMGLGIAGDKLFETGKWGWDRAKSVGNWTWGKAKDGYAWGKDKATDGWENAKELGQKLKDKIPTMEEIKKFGGVIVDNTLVPAKEFAERKYQATVEWWKENYPKFKMDFSEHWTAFKEKFKSWKPVATIREKTRLATSMLGAGFNTLREGAGNLLSGPARLKRWVGTKIRSGVNMLKGFMTGGMWAAMKYRDAEHITDEVSGLRQVYLGIVDLQSIIMDRLQKKRFGWNDKDGDGKRDASSRFIGREADGIKVDKDGNPVPGSEKKTSSLLSNIFGTSLMGMAIKALIGGIVGETMSNLFGFDLGLVGNTLAGMAAAGAAVWGAKKIGGYATRKAGDLAKSVLTRGRGGRTGAGGAVADVAGVLGGGGCGCCCCDGADDLTDGIVGGSDNDRDKRKRNRKGKGGTARKGGKKPGRGRRAGGSGRRVGNATGGATRAAGAAAGASAASGAAQTAARTGAGSKVLSSMGGKAGIIGASILGALQLASIWSDEEASTEDKLVGSSETVGGMGGALAGAAAGAALGSVVPGVGNVIGGLVGGAIGYWGGSKAGGAIGEGAVNAFKGKPMETEKMLDEANTIWSELARRGNPLTTFRMKQYGMSLARKRESKPILALEKELLANVKTGGELPTATIKRPIEEIYALFGVNPENAEHVKAWATWYHYRFKPIFITHVDQWHKLMRNTKLHDGDEKLGKEAAAEYLKNVHYTNSSRAPYNQLISPFGGETDKLIGVEEVNEAFAIAKRKITYFPSKPMATMEKESVTGTDARDVKAQMVKDAENEVKVGDEAAKQQEKGGFWNSIKETASNRWDVFKQAMPTAAGFLESVGTGLSNIGTGIADGISNVVATMTGSQKEWQMKVYTAFKNAGFSEQQARILTAEIGRENSYAPKYLFGGHADPHKGQNLGMLSWQGDRRPRLIGFLRQAGVLDGKGNIIPGQAALDAQAKFIMWELKNTHAKVGKQFLANPNIGYAEGAYMIGKRYILWRIDDPKYGPSGKRNRDSFYNMLLKQLGAKDGDGATKAATPGANNNALTGAALLSYGQNKPDVASQQATGMGAAAVGVRAQAAGMVASAGAAIGSAVNKGKEVVNDVLSNVGLAKGGETTAVALGGTNGTPWMRLAEQQLGVSEKDHPDLIREYHKIGGRLNAGGKTPWCASFVGWVLEKCGLKSTGSAAAISYAKYGTPLDKSKPIPYGAIMVIKFGTGNHVAFCAGDQGSRVTMLGGNQSSKKNGDQRNGGEVTKSTIPKANVYAVVYPSGYAPGAAKTTPDNVSDAVSGVGDYAGGGGAMSGAGAKNVNGFSFKWKGEKKGNVAVDPLEHLKQLRGETTSGNTPAKSTALSKVGTAAVKADEQNKADDARKKMLLSNEVALSQIAGFGLTGAATNASGMTGKAVTASAIAKQNEADLKAVIEAEKETATLSSREREAERLAKVNLEAKTRRVTQSSLDSQAQLVNIMQESLAEQKRMNQTLISINKGIQSLVTNSAASLRGEEKPKAATPRPVTPPETVPVSMRV